MTAHEVADPHIWNDKDGAAVVHGRLSAKTSAGTQPGRGLFIAAPGTGRPHRLPKPHHDLKACCARAFEVARRSRGRSDHPFGALLDPDGHVLMEQSAASRRKVMTFQPRPSGRSPPVRR